MFYAVVSCVILSYDTLYLVKSSCCVHSVHFHAIQSETTVCVITDDISTSHDEACTRQVSLR